VDRNKGSDSCLKMHHNVDFNSVFILETTKELHVDGIAQTESSMMRIKL
jgi:hypothetical protein